jgi:hypothetical protein
VERDLERLAEAIASGGDPIPELMDRLRRAEVTRQHLLDRVRATPVTTQPKWSDIERRIRRSLTAWRARFSGGIAEARDGLRELLTTPILFTPCVVRGHHAIRFSGKLGLQAVFGGTVVVTGLASQSAPSWNQMHEFLQEMRRLREAGIPAA